MKRTKRSARERQLLDAIDRLIESGRRFEEELNRSPLRERDLTVYHSRPPSHNRNSQGAGAAQAASEALTRWRGRTASPLLRDHNMSANRNKSIERRIGE
jgi:hypothetical protein